MFIVIYGNIVDGFEFFGPFTTITEAIIWAEQEGPSDSWHTAKLKAKSRKGQTVRLG